MVAKSSKEVALVQDEAQSAEPSPRVVYVQAPVLLGRLVRADGDEWIVRLGGQERTIAVDETVDRALLWDAYERGARVLVDQSDDEPVIAGVVATQRSLVIDTEGHVDVELESMKISARTELLLKTPGAFLRAMDREVELFGDTVLTRARNLAKVLAAMIKLN